MTKVDQNLTQHSRLIKELNRILIESHSQLIKHNTVLLLNEDFELQRTLQAKRCIGLLNLIRSTGDRMNETLLNLQQTVENAS